MARFAPNAFYSNGFNYIKNGNDSAAPNGRRIVILDSEQTEYANIAAATLAEAPLIDSQLTEANGTVSGRRLNVAQIADIEIDESGDATHVAIVDDDDDEVLYVTVCTTQTLTDGGTVTIPTWGVELRAPAAP